ncbi:hypothetical protein OPAG_06833 [Rhodococcus opacus PD630]|nr:hypothetical protein OPAG_06833 [Rhodococcus opacus PD630]
MNQPGGDNLLVQARSALLDALHALDDHRDALIVIGAQAVYLRSGAAVVALAESTKDSDLAVNPRNLRDDPHLEDAMTGAGFYLNTNGQPGAWVNPDGIPVDLMVPSALSNRTSPTGRSPRLPPHAKNAMRIATGLEGCVVDNTVMTITALDSNDHRTYDVRVAGTAALLVAKIHKIHERLGTPDACRTMTPTTSTACSSHTNPTTSPTPSASCSNTRPAPPPPNTPSSGYPKCSATPPRPEPTWQAKPKRASATPPRFRSTPHCWPPNCWTPSPDSAGPTPVFVIDARTATSRGAGAVGGHHIIRVQRAITASPPTNVWTIAPAER